MPLIVLVLFAKESACTHGREHIVGPSATVESLRRWWFAIGGVAGLMFVITAIAALLFLRLFHRRITGAWKILCIANAFLIWLFIALAAITSDPAASPVLAHIGLGTIGDWLYSLGLLWSIFLLFVIFKAVDSGKVE